MLEPLLPVSDLEKAAPIFRGKAGRALARFLFKVLGVDKAEKEYARLEGLDGPDATGAFLRNTGVNYSVQGGENLADLPDGPFITISNHPIGSIDGIILVDYMGHRYPGYKVMVNKFLMRIKVMNSSFISVIPTGEERTAPTPESIGGVRAAVRQIKQEGLPLGLFPSGAVSDLKPGRRPVVTLPDGTTYTEPRIRDREWQMPIVKFISRMNVPVVPIRFFDGNSGHYYRLGALFGWKVRLLRFPREVTNKRGKTIRLGIGPVITPAQQAACKDMEELRALLRGSVYSQEIKKK